MREAEYLWTTVAYILWPSGARKLLAELPGLATQKHEFDAMDLLSNRCELFAKSSKPRPVNQPVDNFMSNLVALRTLRGFATVPKLAPWQKSVGLDLQTCMSPDMCSVFFSRCSNLLYILYIIFDSYLRLYECGLTFFGSIIRGDTS